MSDSTDLKGKTEVYSVTWEQMLEYERMFPNINVAQNLCSMQVWLDANPAKRPKNVKRFIAGWLIRETAKFEASWQATHRDAQVGRNTFKEQVGR